MSGAAECDPTLTLTLALTLALASTTSALPTGEIHEFQRVTHGWHSSWLKTPGYVDRWHRGFDQQRARVQILYNCGRAGDERTRTGRPCRPSGAPAEDTQRMRQIANAH